MEPSLTVIPTLSTSSTTHSVIFKDLQYIQTPKVQFTGDVTVEGIELGEWMNMVHDILGLPRRNIELESKYPELKELWFEAVVDIQSKMSGIISKKSLEYVKKCDQYTNFETLKKE